MSWRSSERSLYQRKAQRNSKPYIGREISVYAEIYFHIYGNFFAYTKNYLRIYGNIYTFVAG